MRTVTTAAGSVAAVAAAGRSAGLRLADAVSLDVAADSAAALDPDLRVFVGDMVRPYGLPLAEGEFTAAVGQTYAEMGEAVIDALTLRDRPVDLLIEVFASPDVQPGRAASVHLSSYCPGRPFGFALSEQGTAGAFSALALVRSYLAGDGFERALVLVLEQSALHYEPAAGTPVPERHTAVGLLWERGGGLGVDLLDGDGGDSGGRFAPGDAYDRVEKALTDLRGTGGEPLLVLGAGLAGFAPPPGTGTLRARAGNPYTGLWSALTESLPRLRQDGGSALVADYDVLLGYLNLARVHRT